MAGAQALRRPTFLGRAATAPKVAAAAFKTEIRRVPEVVIQEEEEKEDDAGKASQAALAEAQRMAAQCAERTAAAIAVLRATSERLAAEARSDALEIGFLVARRILEMELSTSPEPLVSLVRSAMRRLGESRTIAIRLSPADAQTVAAAIESQGTQAVTPIAISKIDIIPDAGLGRGDCLVEGNLVTVDGRISARIEELRRSLDTATEDNPP